MGSKIGVLKVAATRVGLSLDEYLDHLTANQKRCVRCKRWRSRYDFNADTSRGDGLSPKCSDCQRAVNRASYQPVPEDQRKPMGPPRIPRRSGDKEQARARINGDVKIGIRPDPDTLHCAYCGHKGGDKRHEYHHHMGYDEDHHYDVLPACTTCHHEQHQAKQEG